MQGQALTVHVCFCGGCNPHYDRVAFLHALEALYPQICFCTTQHSDYQLVLNGFLRACAGKSAKGRKTLLLASAALEQAQVTLDEWIQGEWSQ